MTADPGFSLEHKKILVTGHRGMVGSALTRRLQSENCDIETIPRHRDLRNPAEVNESLGLIQPDIVVVAAARVGGIRANAGSPAEFLYDNLMIAANLVHGAHVAGIDRVLFLGSSCIYPKFAAQPIREESLLTGALEPTNEAYAIAKIAGIKLCDAYRRQYGRHYISAMPTNLYGPNDNFDLRSCHVLAALLRKIHEAKDGGHAIVTIWGSGNPRREFMHVDDLADALVFLLKHYDGDGPINVGTNEDLSIRELAALMARIIGFNGSFDHDLDKPDGTPRKLMDSSRILSLGWSPRISLARGIEDTYRWYLSSVDNRRASPAGRDDHRDAAPSGLA